jgi:hypothetical protein
LCGRHLLKQASNEARHRQGVWQETRSDKKASNEARNRQVKNSRTAARNEARNEARNHARSVARNED